MYQKLSCILNVNFYVKVFLNTDANEHKVASCVTTVLRLLAYLSFSVYFHHCFF